MEEEEGMEETQHRIECIFRVFLISQSVFGCPHRFIIVVQTTATTSPAYNVHPEVIGGSVFTRGWNWGAVTLYLLGNNNRIW